MKFLKGFIIGLLCAVVLAGAGIAVAGHFAIVSYFGPEGKVAAIGFDGYGDFFGAVGAFRSSSPVMSDNEKNSDANCAALVSELQNCAVSISSDKNILLMAMYSGIAVYSRPASLSGGMTAAAVNEGLDALKQISSSFDYTIEAVKISVQSETAAELCLIAGISVDQLMKLCKADQAYDDYAKYLFVGDRVYLSASFDAAAEGGNIVLPENIVFSVNSAKSDQTNKIIDYIEKNNDNVLSAAVNSIISAINNWGDITFGSDGDIVLTGNII